MLTDNEVKPGREESRMDPKFFVLSNQKNVSVITTDWEDIRKSPFRQEALSERKIRLMIWDLKMSSQVNS